MAGKARATGSFAGSIERLHRRNLPIGTIELARHLVGKALVHEVGGRRTSGRIVETEAYRVGDPAGHAFRGKTPRNVSLYLARGHAYVYFVYGMYYCLNVSSERSGVGAGVLVRALEPIEGVDIIKERRGSSSLRDLARGPGRPYRRNGDRYSLRRGGFVHKSFIVAWHVWFRISRRCFGEYANRAEPRASLCSPSGIRTRVTRLRTWDPRPLDDGALAPGQRFELR